MRKFLFTLAFALAGLLQGHAQAQQLDTANPAFQDPVTGTYYYYDRQAATTTTRRMAIFTIRKGGCSMPRTEREAASRSRRFR